jgi:hypothetical protein
VGQSIAGTAVRKTNTGQATEVDGIVLAGQRAQTVTEKVAAAGARAPVIVSLARENAANLNCIPLAAIACELTINV